MTPEERDRFVYLVLGEEAIKAITLIMHERHGSKATTDMIMRFAFKVAMRRAIPDWVSRAADDTKG
jgi:hypothetical protein